MSVLICCPLVSPEKFMDVNAPVFIIIRINIRIGLSKKTEIFVFAK